MADLGAVGSRTATFKVAVTCDVFAATSWSSIAVFRTPAKLVQARVLTDSWQSQNITTNPILGFIPLLQKAAVLCDVWAAKNIQLNPALVRGQLVRYLDDPLPQQWVTFSGTVLDTTNNPIARAVRTIRRSDGYLLGETVSNASTGAYSITVPATSEVQVVCLDNEGGTLENDLIHRVLPA
jgi:hypothetical protein